MADNTGAAFGVFPQMRPRRARQDREAAANAPLSALRGWAAGTAGLPGDIEGLLRMLVPGVSNEPALPTSEFYKEWLPGRSLNETPTGRAFTEAGSLAGGVGVGPLSRVAATGARAGGRLGAEALMRAMERGSPLTAMANPMYVVKPKGGNWLSGSVEGSLKDLRNRRYEEAEYNYFNRQQADAGGAYQDWLQAKWAQDPEYRNKPAFAAANEYLKETGQPLLPKEPINAWIDKQLTNYVKNEMATPEDPLRALAEKWAVDKPAKLAEAQARIDALASKIEQTAGQRNVPPEYLTSMRQQMIDLEKQKELIQLREGLHYTPENITSGIRDVAGYHRSAGGYPVEGSATSDLAKAYETLSDFSIGGTTAGEWRKAASPEVLSRIPGLERIPDEAMVYERTSPAMTQNLGFNHLIDELRNATYPGSGLPKELLINPKDLPKITLPQAVDRVADINAWRAAQKAEADMARANNAATVLHKEYPDKGFKWVELKAPKDKPLIEGEYADPLFDIPPNQQEQIYGQARLRADRQGLDEESDEYRDILEGYAQDLATDWAKRNKPKVSKELEDALKYEGDTMGHCVGGYCPDVLEGRSRIFSLRSAKGEPHVTIETKPGSFGGTDREGFISRANELGWSPEKLTEHLAKLDESRAFEPTIVQIKGKANRAPNPEYLPFVQDFVKSGKWSDVGDLGNAGLRRFGDAFNENEIKRIQAAGIDIPTWASPDEIKAIGDKVWPGQYGTPPGFARGGLVQYDPAKIDALTQQLQEELYAA